MDCEFGVNLDGVGGDFVVVYQMDGKERMTVLFCLGYARFAFRCV